MQSIIELVSSDAFESGVLVGALLFGAMWVYSSALKVDSNQLSADMGTAVKLKKGFYYLVSAADYISAGLHLKSPQVLDQEETGRGNSNS